MIRRSLLALVFILMAVTLHAAEPVTVSFSLEHDWFSEAAGVGQVTVNRTGPPGTTLNVPYHSSISGVDTYGTFTFLPNEISKVFSIFIPNDHIYDNGYHEDSYFWVQLLPVPPATTGTPSRINVILIEAEPLPTITVSSAAVPEGNSGTTLVHLTVTLSAPFKRSGDLSWGMFNGTATPDSDYPSGYSYLPFPAGQTSADIVVKINGDQLPEPDETVFVWADVAFIGNSVPGTITILNDDYLVATDTPRLARGSLGSARVGSSVPTPTTDRVTLSSSNPGVVTVPPFIDIPAGSASKTFSVTAVGTGTAVITATSPPSRGSVTSATGVEVYAATFFAFDQPVLSVTLGQTATMTMHVDPPPSESFPLFLTQTNPSVASIPSFFTIDTSGSGTLTLRGTGIGSTLIRTTVPAVYGGATTGFTFAVGPSTTLAISRLDSTSGPVTGGQPLKIFGDAMSGRCTAFFDGISGQNTSSVTSGYITTSPPPHDPGTVAVSVQCGAGRAALPGSYTYTALPSRLTRISPAIAGPAGGVVVAASGENLRRGRCSLLFGGVAATAMQNDSATEMLVVAPSHAAGSADVTLRCGSDVSTLANAFVYTGNDPLAQVAGSNPVSGVPGDRVIVGGTEFRDSDAIFFGDAAGLDVTTTSSEHFVTVPDVAPGNTRITLRDLLGRSVSGPAFRVLAPAAPLITNAPARVNASSELVISGSGFRRSLTFLLGATALQQVVVAPTFARLRLPPSITAGSYPLTIGGSTATARTMDVADGVAVTSVSIPCSSTEGGSLVTITGNGFADGAVVTFGSADSAAVTVRDEHTIQARVPAWSGVSNETITVTNRNGESGQLSNAFHYLSPDPGCAVPRHRGATH